jgi:hypothetical protein
MQQQGCICLSSIVLASACLCLTEVAQRKCMLTSSCHRIVHPTLHVTSIEANSQGGNSLPGDAKAQVSDSNMTFTAPQPGPGPGLWQRGVQLRRLQQS